MGGHVAHGLHQGTRAAAIEVRLTGPLRDQGSDRKGTLPVTVVMMDENALGQLRRGELVKECGGLRGPRAINELEVGFLGNELAHHRYDGRDPDASGDEQVTRGLARQRKVVEGGKLSKPAPPPNPSTMLLEPPSPYEQSVVSG